MTRHLRISTERVNQTQWRAVCTDEWGRSGTCLHEEIQAAQIGAVTQVFEQIYEMNTASELQGLRQESPCS